MMEESDTAGDAAVSVSVITCAHNPDLVLLQRVVEALEKQTLPLDQWEFILVDNNSEPPLLGEVDLSWHPRARVICESDPGLTPARLCGIGEASGKVIIFVDDDNLMYPDYLSLALDYMEKYPHVGALGGYSIAEYQVRPPAGCEEFLDNMFDYPTIPARQQKLQYAYAKQMGPWVPVGAGMVLRREVACHYAEATRSNPFRYGLDRKGTALLGSGDLDMAFTSMDVGLACASSSELKYIHYVPAFRCEPEYLLRLLYATNYGVARLLIDRGWREAEPTRPVGLLQRLRRRLAAFRRRGLNYRCHVAHQRGWQDGVTGNPFDSEYQ